MFGDKKSLSETEIRTRYITPSIVKAGWNYNDIHEEKTFTDGRVIDEGKGKYSRGVRKRTDRPSDFLPKRDRSPRRATPIPPTWSPRSHTCHAHNHDLDPWALPTG